MTGPESFDPEDPIQFGRIMTAQEQAAAEAELASMEIPIKGLDGKLVAVFVRGAKIKPPVQFLEGSFSATAVPVLVETLKQVLAAGVGGTQDWAHGITHPWHKKKRVVKPSAAEEQEYQDKVEDFEAYGYSSTLDVPAPQEREVLLTDRELRLEWEALVVPYELLADPRECLRTEQGVAYSPENERKLAQMVDQYLRMKEVWETRWSVKVEDEPGAGAMIRLRLDKDFVVEDLWVAERITGRYDGASFGRKLAEVWNKAVDQVNAKWWSAFEE